MEDLSVSKRDKRWIEEMAQKKRNIDVRYLKRALNRVERSIFDIEGLMVECPFNMTYRDQLQEAKRLRSLCRSLLDWDQMINDPQDGERLKEFYNQGEEK